MKLKNIIYEDFVNYKKISMFILTNLINAIILRGLTVANYFAIKPVLADLSILLIVSAFSYFIKPKHQFKYLFTWSIIFTIICIINSIKPSNYFIGLFQYR